MSLPISATRASRNAPEKGARLATLEQETVTATLRVGSRASERLRQSLVNGIDHFILMSTDGATSLHARVSIARVDHRHPAAPPMLVVDWAHGSVTAGARSVWLSRTELRILGTLLEHVGKPVSRADLIAGAWPSEPAVTSRREGALAVYIHSLRKHLSVVSSSCTVQAIRGAGYRLIA
jgi:DNA-binding response OmpR family regulator